MRYYTLYWRKKLKINVFNIATGDHLGFSLDIDLRSSKGCQKWIPCMRSHIKRCIAQSRVVRISKWLLAAILDFRPALKKSTSEHLQEEGPRNSSFKGKRRKTTEWQQVRDCFTGSGRGGLLRGDFSEKDEGEREGRMRGQKSWGVIRELFSDQGEGSCNLRGIGRLWGLSFLEQGERDSEDEKKKRGGKLNFPSPRRTKQHSWEGRG